MTLLAASTGLKLNIDKLILNYLIQEGYKEAAILLAKETDVELVQHDGGSELDAESISFLDSLKTTRPEEFLQLIESHNSNSRDTFEPQKNLKVTKGYSTINQRREIKHLILQGSITKAIEKISEYFPVILDSNNLLHSKLLKLNLIEMIRVHKLSDNNDDTELEKQFLHSILEFVRENLINKVTKSVRLLKELEITMSLLCFNLDPSSTIEDQKDLPKELRSLFDLSLRAQCYRLVNRAILNLNNSDNYLTDDLDDVNSYQAKYDKLKYETEKRTTYKHELISDLESGEEEANESDKRPQDDDTTDEEANRLQELAYESKLEQVLKLWAVTEQRMVDLNIVKAKRYDLAREL